MGFHFLNTCLFCVCAALGAHGQGGAPPPALYEAGAQIRGAAVDPARGLVFLAAYDKNEVWAVDPASGDRIWTAKVGRGPAALAFSAEADLLACANRLENTVSFLRPETGTLTHTVPVGDGPGGLAATASALYAANTFSDSISRVSLSAEPAVMAGIENVPVPGAIAVTAAGLAVADQATPSVRVYALPAGTSGEPAVVFPLDLPAHGLAGAGADAVLVLTGNKTLLLDARKGSVLRQASIAGLACGSNGKEHFVLTAGEILVLDDALDITRRLPLAAPAQALEVSGGIIAALSPRTRQWQLWNPARLAAAVAPRTSAPPEPAPAAEPKPHRYVVTKVPPPKAAPPPPLKTAAETEAAPPFPILPPTRTYRRHPLATGAARAPHPGIPTSMSIDPMSRQTFAKAFRMPTVFGSAEAGFLTPDWNQVTSLEDIKFDDQISASPEGGYHVKGNVSLRMGAMTFSCQELDVATDPVRIHAAGDVRITQEASEFTADEIHFEALPEPARTGSSPFKIDDSADAAGARERGRGKLAAENARITEPGWEMVAEHIDYNFADQTGEIINAAGRADIYFFSAEHLDLLGDQSFEGEEVWLTTCDRPKPHYKIRFKKVSVKEGQVEQGTHVRLQLGEADTPFYLPQLRHGRDGGYPWTVDFDSGRQADVGYYVNLGQRYEISPDAGVGPRVFITEQEGVGFGGDLDYDFRERPASRLFRAHGEARGLYTTEQDGYFEWFHRYEPSENLVLRMQAEQWNGREFYKDYFYELFRERTEPRTYANLTYRRDRYLATATARPAINGWTSETERLPEFTFHLLERPIAKKLYFSFDTINGYNNSEPRGGEGARTVNIARLSYDWDPTDAFNVTPFAELEATWYSRERQGGNASGRFSATTGATVQSRFHRTYPGHWGFSAFKHVIVPSLTYSYRPRSSMSIAETPRFDALDNVFGRSRIESKIDNVLYGRDAETGEVWQLGRLTLYQGNDLASETRKTDDYEIEVDLRPRPWWGFQFSGERHVAGNEDNIGPLQRYLIQGYERLAGSPGGGRRDFNNLFGDFSRVLSQVYYDDTYRGGRFNGRLGFAYTRTRQTTFNREIHYGLGYRFGEKWGLGLEHIYDLERNGLRTQTWEIRRTLHAWEAALRVRDRESGIDLNLEFNIRAFPGSSVKL